MADVILVDIVEGLPQGKALDLAQREGAMTMIGEAFVAASRGEAIAADQLEAIDVSSPGGGSLSLVGSTTTGAGSEPSGR